MGLVAAFVLSALSLVGAIWLSAQCACEMRSAEAQAIDALKQVVAAEKTWYASDVDGNGIQDYWTGDVAALYGAIGPDGQPARLVDLEVARMDAQAAERHRSVGHGNAWFGYVMTPLVRDSRGMSYQEDLDRDGLAEECSFGFAFVAYPERRRASFHPHLRHRLSTDGQLLIDERGLPKRLDMGDGAPAQQWPEEPERWAWLYQE